MNILLLGSHGLLGSEFARILSQYTIDFEAPSRQSLDITDSEKVDSFFASASFDMILFCAAYTHVDRAEEDRLNCHKINVQGLHNIIKQKIPILHFSSDYVFHAPHGLEIPENHPRKPLNYYAHTKVEAEKLLENASIPFWNIRTSWLFGPAKDNFITKILKKSELCDVLEVVSDQIGRPTYVKDLAEYIIQNFLFTMQPFGHYHLQNTGRPISWADLADFVLNYNGLSKDVVGITTKQLDLPAQRPQNSLLLNTKISPSLRPWEEAVQDFLSSLE